MKRNVTYITRKTHILPLLQHYCYYHFYFLTFNFYFSVRLVRCVMDYETKHQRGRYFAPDLGLLNFVNHSSNDLPLNSHDVISVVYSFLADKCMLSYLPVNILFPTESFLYRFCKSPCSLQWLYFSCELYITSVGGKRGGG